MPTFDFLCRDCQGTFEATVPFGSRAFPPCPVCGGRNIEKKISPPAGIVFKGSGFYKTDSRAALKEEKPPKASLAEGGKKQESRKSDKADTTAKGGADASKTS